MKRFIFIFAIVIDIFFKCTCQVTVSNPKHHGINFITDLSWRQIKERAKKENKFIFVDCFASWCGPCKFMRDNIFTQDSVGAFMNDNFISVAVQMDKTLKDATATQKWYKDANDIQRKYDVNIFPTYLVFSQNGEPVNRIVGFVTNFQKAFTDTISASFVTTKQFYAQQAEFQKMIVDHRDDSAFLINMLKQTIEENDNIKNAFILSFVVKYIGEPMSETSVQLIRKATFFTNDSGFAYLYKNRKRIEAMEGSADLDDELRGIIFKDEINPLFYNDGLDWDGIAKRLKRKFPPYAARVIAESKPDYYLLKHRMKDYEKAIVAYMAQYRSVLIDYWVNARAWDVFLNSNNRSTLLKASAWSKELLQKDARRGVSDPNNIDTYANLLYKSDDKTGAIEWEKRAVAAARRDSAKLSQFSETLRKMSTNIKTWE